MPQQLYLTLPSNSTDFNSNTTSNFRVRLPNPIELGGGGGGSGGGEWECGLAQIDYPHSFDNVTDERTDIGLKENVFFLKFTQVRRKKQKKKSNKTSQRPEDKRTLPIAGRRLRLKFSVPLGSYDTVTGLVDAVNKSIAKTQFTADSIKAYNSSQLKREKILKWYKKQKDQNGSPLFLVYNKNTRRVHFNVKWGINSALFSPKLHYMLGISSGRWVHLSSSGGGFITEYPPDLTAGFNTLFVYCNLIEPQIVGNELLPLLRTVSIKGKQGDFVSEIFQSPHYVKIQTKTFDTVEISLKNDLSEHVKFNFGKVIVKLHLRQIPRSIII